MTTIEQIRKAAFQVIRQTIVLKTNVSNGCYADRKELEEKMERIYKIKEWAEKNNQMSYIKHYFASANFGHLLQFSANEISKVFYN